MKFLIVLCAVAACALAAPTDDVNREALKNKYKEIFTGCTEESGTTKEVAEQLRNGVFDVRDEPAQCFVDCFFKRIDFINEKGELQPEVMIEKLHKKSGIKTEELKSLVDKCALEKGEGKCETAFKVYECYRPSVPYKKEH